jgi:pyrroline-5-carboxylate reductase
MREDQLDAEGAVVSCGPAYIALFVDALTRAGVKAGLPAGACREMVLATMGGVVKGLMESGEHPRAYMEKVTSPGGTTAAGLYAMEPLLEEAAYAAVEAALVRTEELAKG